MRSRTELVTTTFVDSEEDPTESDDSEEDWRPTQSGKRRPTKPLKSRRKKRKMSHTAHHTFKDPFSRQQIQETAARDQDYLVPKQSTAAEQKLFLEKLVAEKNTPEGSGSFRLYLYKKDLDENYKQNSHLSLWGRDGSNLLQKYIRVKTTNPEEFIFTSSSVYSSWDERRRKDFTTIAVKYMEENNRRVTLVNSSDLVNIVNDTLSRKGRSFEQNSTFDNESANTETSDPDENDEEEDDDEVYDEDDDDDESYDVSSDGENEKFEQNQIDDECRDAQSDTSGSNDQ